MNLAIFLLSFGIIVISTLATRQYRNSLIRHNEMVADLDAMRESSRDWRARCGAALNDLEAAERRLDMRAHSPECPAYHSDGANTDADPDACSCGTNTLRYRDEIWVPLAHAREWESDAVRKCAEKSSELVREAALKAQTETRRETLASVNLKRAARRDAREARRLKRARDRGER